MGFMDSWLDTAPVGQFPPNALGLYDLGGNVAEWVSTNYGAGKKNKTLRGGSYLVFSSRKMRSNHRESRVSGGEDTGFRVVLETSREAE